MLTHRSQAGLLEVHYPFKSFNVGGTLHEQILAGWIKAGCHSLRQPKRPALTTGPSATERIRLSLQCKEFVPLNPFKGVLRKPVQRSRTGQKSRWSLSAATSGTFPPDPGTKPHPEHLKGAAPEPISSADREAVDVPDIYAKLLPHVRRQWRLIAQAWVCTIVSLAALLLVIPRLGRLSSLLSKGDLAGVLRLAGATMALVGLRCVGQYGQDVWLWEAALEVTSSVRKQVYGHVQELGLSHFEGSGDTAAGDTAYRLTAEADQMGAMVFAFLQRLVPSALQLVAMLAKMLALSPFLSGATLAVAPLMSLLIARLGERVSRLSRSSQDQVAGLSAHLNEVLPAMLVVKAHAAEDYELARFGALADAHRAARMAFHRQQALFSPAITLVYAATVVSLFAAGTWAIAHGRFSGEKMVSFITSLVLLIEPIQAVGSAYNEIKQGQPAVERVFEVLATPSEATSATVTTRSTDSTLRGEIVFDSVSFSYRERPVLSNVSFRIGEGETVALVGPSGSGKTTLVKLLLRLYEPEEGSIQIGETSIRNVPSRALRRHLGFVPQDSILFSGTVAENIAYGVPPEAIDLSAVERAAQRAHADGFVSRLSGGYEGVLGERGSTLSGGQKQRLAIARAIYHEPACLILDEATSALDNESEVLVRDALQRLMAEKTVIIIAHKLETIQTANRILFMEDGQIVEQGTHLELLERRGRYASFYQTQQTNERL